MFPKLGHKKEQWWNTMNQKKVYTYKMFLYCDVRVRKYLPKTVIDSDICEVDVRK